MDRPTASRSPSLADMGKPEMTVEDPWKPRVIACPIKHPGVDQKGHHNLIFLKRVHQSWTREDQLNGFVPSFADWYECPTGNYRWFLVDDREPSEYNRHNKPHWGWKD